MWYSFVIPVFETPDENYHYAFARHLSQGNWLPVQTIDADGPWRHEGTQAPLYYLMLGGLISGIDQSDFDQIAQINPRANLGNPNYPGNKNFMLFSTLSPPLTGTNLAAHIGRWFSLLLSVGTLWFTYGIGRLAFPRSPALALLVLAVAASIPQFGFISASVSNDSLVIFMATVSLYTLARLLRRDLAVPIANRDWLLLGVLLALAAISKLQGLSLYMLAGLMIPYLGWQRRDWRLVIRAGVILGLCFAVIAAWWYVRNYLLYGEIFAIDQLLEIEGLRTAPQTWAAFWSELRGLRYSFWGLFGWFSILMPVWIYPILDGIAVIAVVGSVAGAVQSLRRSESVPVWLKSGRVRIWLGLGLYAIILVGLMLYWLTFAISSQGRLLFPGISAFSVLLVGGLAQLLHMAKVPRSTLVLGGLPVFLLGCSVYALIFLLPASYQAPAPVADIPATAQPVGKIYGDSLELVAIDLPQDRYRPGDTVPITLYLRTLAPQTRNYELFVQLLDQENLLVGNVTTHPGWGRNPTSLWQPGAIYADEYAVTVWDNISSRSPLLAKIYVGFADAESGIPVPVQGTEVEPVNRTVGTVILEPTVSLDPRLLYFRETDTRFGPGGAELIQLTGYRIPAQISAFSLRRVAVSLYWYALDEAPIDYTAFVHLIDEDGNFVVGFDQPPAEGRFPTRLWRPGDGSLSDFTLSLPPDLSAGTYEIWAGLYDGNSENLDRLSITASDRPTQDNRVMLGTVTLP